MTLTTHYIKAVIWPSLWVVILTSIFAYFESRGYKSEWFTAISGIWMGIGVAIFFSALICTASLSIFLVKYKVVLQSKIFVFGAWFILPFGLMSYFIIDNILRKIEYGGLLEFENLLIGILTVPFMAGLISSYIQFIRTNNTTT